MSWLGDKLKQISGYNYVKEALTGDKARAEAYGRDDTQIQRRVADAKAAGVHPLYALGASTTAGPTFATGSRVGDAIGSISRSVQKGRKSTGLSLVDKAAIAESESRTRESNARTDTVLWNLENSKVKRAQQLANTQQDSTQVKILTDDVTANQGSDIQQLNELYGDEVGDAVGMLEFANDVIEEYSTDPTGTKNVLTLGQLKRLKAAQKFIRARTRGQQGSYKGLHRKSKYGRSTRQSPRSRRH